MFGRKAENILIVKTDGLASFVAAEPVFAAIRRTFANARISLITRQSLQRIARAAPYFDQVAALPDLSDAEARAAFVKQIKSQKFAQIFDLSADDDARRLQSALGPFGPKWKAAGPAPKLRKGETSARHLAPDYGRFLAVAGLDADSRLPDFSWALAARKDSANMQPSWFGVSGAFGLLLPGPDAAVRWPSGAYARLAQLMARAHVMPVLAGGKELHTFGDEIAHDAPEIVDLSGKTDHLQLVALAQEASFFVADHAEEAFLALSVGLRGVMIRKAGDAAPPEGRDVVIITARELSEAQPDLVWRTLNSMGLVPDAKTMRRSAS